MGGKSHKVTASFEKGNFGTILLLSDSLQANDFGLFSLTFFFSTIAAVFLAR